MKKTLLASLVCMGVLASGCGGNKGENGGKFVSAPPEKIEEGNFFINGELVSAAGRKGSESILPAGSPYAIACPAIVRYEKAPGQNFSGIPNFDYTESSWDPQYDLSPDAPSVAYSWHYAGGFEWRDGYTERTFGSNWVQHLWRCDALQPGLYDLRVYDYYSSVYHGVSVTRRIRVTGPDIEIALESPSQNGTLDCSSSTDFQYKIIKWPEFTSDAGGEQVMVWYRKANQTGAEKGWRRGGGSIAYSTLTPQLL